MPRGIPKDPNHPRNKKRLETAAPTSAEPKKKRGRPPGSGKKNTAVVEVSKAKSAASQKHTVSAKTTKSDPVKTSLASEDQIASTRANIKVIAEAISLAGTSPDLTAALMTQVNKLTRLTDDSTSTQNEETEEVEEQTASAPAPALTSVPPSVPAPQPAPAAVGGNNLPTPPSFVPPPFPPVSQ